jgi:hypothetical protein
MMKTNSDTTQKFYIGLDVHKEQTSVAVADPGPQGEVRSHGSIMTCLNGVSEWGQCKPIKNERSPTGIYGESVSNDPIYWDKIYLVKDIERPFRDWDKVEW